MDLETDHPPLDDALHPADDNDDSDASDHDTDTMSDTKLNHSPDSTFNDAHAEVLGAFKGADCSVMCWRVIVKIIMICIAIILTALTYVQLSQSEEKDFEASVRDDCNMILCVRSFNDDLTIFFCTVQPLLRRYAFVLKF